MLRNNHKTPLVQIKDSLCERLSLLFDMSTDGEGLFVSEAFHEARIEVTEEGQKQLQLQV